MHLIVCFLFSPFLFSFPCVILFFIFIHVFTADFTLDMLMLFSWLIKSASVRPNTFFWNHAFHICHVTSGIVIFKWVNIHCFQPSNWVKSSSSSLERIHQRYIKLWFMQEGTVHKPPNLWGEFPLERHIHIQPPGTHHFPHTSGVEHSFKKSLQGITTFTKHSAT